MTTSKRARLKECYLHSRCPMKLQFQNAAWLRRVYRTPGNVLRYSALINEAINPYALSFIASKVEFARFRF